MAIVTFWSDEKHPTDQTISMAAVATQLALDHNYKILMINTRKNDQTMMDAFFDLEQKSKIKMNTSKTDLGTGLTGLVMAVASNKVSPEIVTNYTKIIFNNRRLELLTNTENIDEEQYEKQTKYLKEIIKVANKYYDLVFVDIEGATEDELIQSVIDMSDLVAINITQKLRAIKDYMNFRDETNIINKNKRILLVNRYDKYSKYNIKNLMSYMKEKELFEVPYGTLFYESCYTGNLIDYFYKFRKPKPNNPNTEIINSINQISTRIITKLKEMRTQMY